MNAMFANKSQFHVGTLLLRVTLAYSLLQPTYFIAASFQAHLGLGFAIAQGIGLFLFAVGGLFFILGFKTRVASLVLFIFLVVVHFALQGPTYTITQIVLFLVLFFLGPGRYSLDYKFQVQKTPEILD